jgi:hypothetical protein
MSYGRSRYSALGTREPGQTHMRVAVRVGRTEGLASRLCFAVTCLAFGCYDLNRQVEQIGPNASTWTHRGSPPRLAFIASRSS